MYRGVWFFAVLLLAGLSGCEDHHAAGPATANPPLAHHVMIVSIDGCRPDVLLRAELELQARGRRPTIVDLMSEGCFTFWADTTEMAITLPSHTSMLTGVRPETHGVTWNTLPPGPIVYPRVSTLFEVAKRHGMTTSIFAGKHKFLTLARPGAIDWGYVAPDLTFVEDEVVARVAAKVIREHQPNVIFVHLAETDYVGHTNNNIDLPVEYHGWGTPAQLIAVERADQCVGLLVAALKSAGIYNDTLTIITSDHGGAGGGHGPGDPRSRHIPWICVGPQVRQNYDLTRSADLVVHTEDTFATACYFLGLPLPANIDGKPVLTIVHDRELMQ